MDLLRQRQLAHLSHGLIELGQDLLVVLADLEALGVDDAQVADLVEVEMTAARNRLANTSTRYLLAEDCIDQGRFTDARLAKDRQIEPPDCCVLPVILGPE